MKYAVKLLIGADTPITRVVEADEYIAHTAGLVFFTRGDDVVLAVGTANVISIEQVQ